jgi:colanic acid/amylovoran biosynthesis glycosyltransferase
MKITFLVSRFPEISEQFIINQVIGLIDAGVDVRVLSIHRPSDTKKHSTVEEYRLRDRTEYIGVPESFLLRAVLALPLALYLVFAAPRAFLRCFDRRYTTGTLSLKLLFLLARLRGKKINLLHTHFGPNGILGAYLKDVGIAEKLVATFHGADINKYPKKHGRNAYARLFAAADLLTANTNFTKGRITDHGCPAGKIEILPVGLVMRDFIVPKQSLSSGTPPVILTVGRLVEKKGHRYALEAAAMLKARGIVFRYIIAGDGPLRRELEGITADLGLRDRVEFTGLMNNEEIKDLYGKGAVFVLPSVTAADGDMEGQGLVLQEAQAIGLPVVTTLHNGIPDGVLDGRSGYLVPEKDPNALADKIEKLLNDRELREKMGREGRLFVEKNYDIPLLTVRLLDAYRCYGLLKGSHSPA